jgi:hypothetical protein
MCNGAILFVINVKLVEILPYKVVVRYVDREEAVKQFDLLDEVLEYLSTYMGHVFGRKDVIGILILRED